MEKSTGVRVSQSAVKKPKNKGDRRLSRLLLMTLLSAGYLLPTAIAIYRKRLSRVDTALLCVLNIGSGWTILGWGVTLYLALRDGEDSQASSPQTHTASVRKVTFSSAREWRGASLGVRPRAAYPAPRPREDLPPAMRSLLGEHPSGIRYGENRYALLSAPQRLLAERQMYSPTSRALNLVNVKRGWLQYLLEDSAVPPAGRSAPTSTGRSSWAQRIAEEEAEYARSGHSVRRQVTRRSNRLPPRQQGELAKGSSGLSRIERFAML